MSQILIGFFLLFSQSLIAEGVPVYVDRAVSAQVQTGTSVTGRVVAGAIYTLSAEVSESVSAVNVRVGDTVTRGDELARFDATEIRNHLKSLKAQQAYLRVHLDLLMQRKRVRVQQLERAKGLTSRDLLTRDVTEQAELNVIQTESDVGKTTYELEDLRIDIADSERQLKQTRVLANANGQILEVSVTEGQYVKSGDQLFQLLPELGVEVEVEVRPEAYESMAVGQVVSGQLRNSPVDLRVRALIAEQNQRTGSRVIRLEFVSPPKPNLVLGESIDLKLPIGQRTERVTIAKDSVIPSKEGHRVVVIVDGKAESRRIELGAGVGDRIVIIKGVTAGDVVVTQGQEGLRKGQRVSVVGNQS